MKHFIGTVLLLNNEFVDEPFGKIVIIEKKSDYLFSSNFDEYFKEMNVKFESFKLNTLCNNEIKIFEGEEFDGDFSCIFAVKATNKIEAMLLISQELSKIGKDI